MKKDCWNCKNDYRYEKFPCDYCHSENINDFWKPKDEMKDFAIAELEEIKAEMEVIHDRHKINIRGYSMSVAQDCIDIIDNHIKELENG